MFFSRNENQNGVGQAPQEIPSVTAVPALVDTSVIIDGRIVDIAQAGFAPGKLLVPRFVLAELQLIADSGDAMKRSRGRRGLEMLHTMRQAGVDMDIIEDDYSDIKEVDAKLVRLGRHLGCNVLTTDYNLNRVASIEGVRVLNINELANAVRPVVIPGENMRTKIVQAGKEKGQGVGYLADGTMIVVDGGDKLMGQDVEVEITRVFQTVAGKMLFAVLVKALGGNSGGGAGSSDRGNKPQHGNRQPTPTNHQQKPARDNRNRQAQPKGNQPKAVQSTQPVAAKASASPSPSNSNSNSNNGKTGKPGGGNGNGNGRRPKRVSPTQRLEDSLMEMTGGGDSASPASPKKS
ncbi:MAG TPA: TRAM domain-containing protein [Candidatus Saccharimonadales bacterium]|nr:TRAM domain-containing protein [Candidatus Saccharimonadales bacterium]